MNKSVLKLTTIALLSAMGVILMSYIQIPYPIAPFLKIEVSDFVVMFTFLLFGLKEAVVVALLKTGCDLLLRGPEAGGSVPFVAHLTALIASLTYVLALWIVNKLVKKEKIEHKIMKYGLVVLIVSAVMTFANYAILTPLFLGDFSLFGIGASANTKGAIAGITGVDSFFLGIVVLYLPFNLIKASLICVIAASTGDALLELYRRKFKVKDKRYEEIT